ncbi:MAG: serine hydrolase [Lentisphaeria bacterium]|nr:serine hydrolase [Lentisphaeria bacterium]
MLKDLTARSIAPLLLSGVLPAAAAVESIYPGDSWAVAEPAEVGMDAGALAKARDYALSGGGSGCVIRGGYLVCSWGDQKQRYDLKSTTKSFGTAALGLALKDGRMRLEDRARQYHPALGTPPETNAQTGWLDDITLLHLASQTAGFEKPGGYTPLLFRPGTQWDYSDSGPNWLAECITLVYRRDLDELMFERVFGPLGIRREDLVWRKNAYRPDLLEGIKRREFGAGIHANVDAMARFGLLWLRGGLWRDEQILPSAFVDRARTTVPGVPGLPVRVPENYGNAANHYGLLWWNNADETIEGLPLDTYWSWGLYDSLIVVMPSLDIVVARAGRSWERRQGAGHYEVLKPFLLPIVAAATTGGAAGGHAGPASGGLPPYPPSPVIAGIRWASPEHILRLAPGSDNWPLTWADDDHQYTAYGDGWGFEPKLPQKLSLGVARVEGAPDGPVGVNIPSATMEQTGDGRRGRKASGLLCVKGRLYLWARNAGNAQLAWSDDHAVTWQWADWRFTESFGCPAFVNFGRDYAGARDRYVYVVSFDSDTAYDPADRMVLARVPVDRIVQRDAYEFFVGRRENADPIWDRDIARRGAVFEHPGRCYRGGMTYHPVLRRYLWVQIIPGSDTRFQGGFGVYDAPEPWGPWTTAFFTESWDVGPGESASFPTKWLSPDGRSGYLVFSGNDHFSLREATFLTPADVP